MDWIITWHNSMQFSTWNMEFTIAYTQYTYSIFGCFEHIYSEFMTACTVIFSMVVSFCFALLGSMMRSRPKNTNLKVHIMASFFHANKAPFSHFEYSTKKRC